jgi:putative transposase
MGAAVRLRTDFSAGELRLLAKRAEDADQARRLLSLAAVLDGMSRKAAAEIGAMDRQTLCDWAHRYNERGPEGLINAKAPGPRPKLSPEQKQELKRIVEAGPDPPAMAWCGGAASTSDASSRNASMSISTRYRLAVPSRSSALRT